MNVYISSIHNHPKLKAINMSPISKWINKLWYIYIHTYNIIFSSVQFSLSVVSNSLPPHRLQHARPPSIANSRSLLKLMSIESVMPSNHLILCHPLLLPSIFPSIRVLSKQSALCIRWAKYWSVSINPSSEYSGLLSFRID